MPSSKDNPVSEPAHCPVRTTLALIGGKHKAFILWNLFDGTKRFSQLQKAVPQANAKMLSQQLKELERDGLISRKAYAVVPPKVEYSLTDLGKSLKPVLSCVYEWGTSYLQSRAFLRTVPCNRSTRSLNKLPAAPAVVVTIRFIPKLMADLF